MAVKIRLTRLGRKKLPYYRIVVADIEAKRDGVHSFCITIDIEVRDHLPHMCGGLITQ